MRALVAVVVLSACGFSKSGSRFDDAPEIDAPEIDARDIDALGTCAQNTVTCPASYVKVPNNCAFGAGEFCIAKYEMKDVGGVATSQAALAPWGTITLANAKLKCTALGPGYHLITNAEWMATARAIEATPENWSTTTSPGPFLSKGKTDDCQGPCPGQAACPSAAGADNMPCTGVNITGCQNRNSTAFRYNRTHRIGTNGVIWDFAGNMFELVDHPATHNMTEGMSTGQDINTTTGTAFSPALDEKLYKSANLNHHDVPTVSMMPQQSVQNIGILYVTVPAIDAFNYTRGGDFCGFAGIYSIALLRDVELGVNIGFRCTYRN